VDRDEHVQIVLEDADLIRRALAFGLLVRLAVLAFHVADQFSMAA